MDLPDLVVRCPGMDGKMEERLYVFVLSRAVAGDSVTSGLRLWPICRT